MLAVYHRFIVATLQIVHLVLQLPVLVPQTGHRGKPTPHLTPSQQYVVHIFGKYSDCYHHLNSTNQFPTHGCAVICHFLADSRYFPVISAKFYNESGMT